MSSQPQHRLKVKLPPMMERTASSVMKSALESIPDKIALRDPAREFSYRGLVEEGLKLAGALIDLGLNRQQTVLAMLDNSAAFPDRPHRGARQHGVSRPPARTCDPDFRRKNHDYRGEISRASH